MDVENIAPARYSSSRRQGISKRRYRGRKKTFKPVSPGFSKSLLSPIVHYHIRCVAENTWVTSTTNDAVYALGFQLSSVTNVAELTSLYDYFRIIKVDILMFPNQGIVMQTGNTASLTNGAYFGYYIDYDDVLPPTMADMQQRANTHWRQMGKKYQITVYPKRLVQTSTAGVAQGIIASGKEWTDMAIPETMHHGFKIAFARSDIIQSYRYIQRFHILCKTTR